MHKIIEIFLSRAALTHRNACPPPAGSCPETEKVSATASDERVIGTIRRECLDHVIILNERHLRRILGSYLDYYHGSRTHLSLGKDTPDGRPVQPAGCGRVVSLSQVGGLHHCYERLAA